jgi:hypothetical protein
VRQSIACLSMCSGNSCCPKWTELEVWASEPPIKPDGGTGRLWVKGLDLGAYQAKRRDGQAGKCPVRHLTVPADRHADGRTDGRTDRQAGGWTKWRTDRGCTGSVRRWAIFTACRTAAHFRGQIGTKSPVLHAKWDQLYRIGRRRLGQTAQSAAAPHLVRVRQHRSLLK